MEEEEGYEEEEEEIESDQKEGGEREDMMEGTSGCDNAALHLNAHTVDICVRTLPLFNLPLLLSFDAAHYIQVSHTDSPYLYLSPFPISSSI